MYSFLIPRKQSRMKDKLLAIIDAPCDDEIKVDLLEEYVKACCEEYIVFNVERNDLIISSMGIVGFFEDAAAITKRELFERFKDYLSEKYQIKKL